MMIYRWESDIQYCWCSISLRCFQYSVIDVAAETSILLCDIGHCRCCTCWIIGNSKISRSTIVWFCEPKDSCGWSWEVLSKLIIMSIILNVHFLLFYHITCLIYATFVSTFFFLAWIQCRARGSKNGHRGSCKNFWVQWNSCQKSILSDW